MARGRRSTRTRGDGPASPFRRRLPVILLLVAMGLAGIGVAQAYDAHRSHRATAEALLRDYGIFAARSFRQSWSATLDLSLRATLADARSSALRQSTTAQCLTTLLQARERDADASCACPSSIPLVGDDAWAFHLTLGGPPGSRLLAGVSPGEGPADVVLDSLVAFVRARSPIPNEALHWVRGPGGDHQLFALAALEAFSSDTVVYGVKVDPTRLDATLEEALDDEQLLPPVLTQGRANRELLAVRLVRSDGREQWRSSSGMGPTLEGTQPVHPLYGGGTLRASVLPEAAGTLVIGGLPANRVPFLLLVFGLAGGLALLALLQLRKEEAFARQRHDFVAGVSHELRTPLAQIRLFVETLRLGRTRTDAERAWALGNIDRETLRLVRLVENILHFHRAERGSLHALETEPADLEHEARSVVDSFMPLLRPHEAEIEVDIPCGLMAEIHRDAFHQVLLNFLDNAVKYGPRGQTIRLVGEGRSSTVRIAVEDQGPGVDPAERTAIWDSFQRGEDAIGSVATGSGIGLSVVREIVDALDGSVWVEDAPGPSGARFVVELPRFRSASAHHLGSSTPGDGRRAPPDAAPETMDEAAGVA